MRPYIRSENSVAERKEHDERSYTVRFHMRALARELNVPERLINRVDHEDLRHKSNVTGRSDSMCRRKYENSELSDRNAL